MRDDQLEKSFKYAIYYTKDPAEIVSAEQFGKAR